MTFIRLLGLLAVISLKTTCPTTLYVSCYYAVLFSHYVLSVIYARNSLRTLFQNPSNHKSLILLAILTLSTTQSFLPPIVLYFALHFAFRGVYGADNGTASASYPYFFKYCNIWFTSLADSTHTEVPAPELLVERSHLFLRPLPLWPLGRSGEPHITRSNGFILF